MEEYREILEKAFKKHRQQKRLQKLENQKIEPAAPDRLPEDKPQALRPTSIFTSSGNRGRPPRIPS